MNNRELRIKKWKADNAEHVQQYRKRYYEKYGNDKREKVKGALRECACGVVALSEDDLHLFIKDEYSKHGHRNKCRNCASKEARKGTPKVPQKRTCPQCRVTHKGELEIELRFRRTPPSRDKVVGGLALLCKACEFPEEHYYEIDGKYIPKENNESIHNKPKEVI